MNTSDPGLLLPMLFAVATALVLFLIGIFKRTSSERIVRVTADTVILRRKLPKKPNIVCMLPIREESRPEQRLW